MNGQRVENDMFDTMWAFLEMGSQKQITPHSSRPAWNCAK